ncbi:hypothetical protein FXW78_45305 [Rhodococcus opacus]|nr:hypothetical protein [Rhodococcus opacus]
MRALPIYQRGPVAAVTHERHPHLRFRRQAERGIMPAAKTLPRRLTRRNVHRRRRASTAVNRRRNRDLP